MEDEPDNEEKSYADDEEQSEPDDEEKSQPADVAVDIDDNSDSDSLELHTRTINQENSSDEVIF